MRKTVYQCGKCGRVVEIMHEAKERPECCGRPMDNLTDVPGCRSSVTAEHEKFNDEDGPCDDTRAAG